MSADPVSSDLPFAAERREGSPAADRLGLSEAHVRKIGELFRDEYARLVHYMVARTGSWPEARDIAAQAFAQVLEMRDPETVSFLKAYIYRAARNLAIDRAKTGATRERLDPIVRQEYASPSPSPEPLLMQQQRLQVLDRAIEALRPTRKMVLKWRMWEELSYAQIEARFAANGVVVNERTLMRWYAEGLKELRQAIRAAEELRMEGPR